MPRPAIPTSVEWLRGNPGHHALPAGDEPRPAILVALGDPPEYLGEYGSAEWQRLGPLLIEQGLLTEADLLPFASYCLQAELLVTSANSIQEHGMTVPGRAAIRSAIRRSLCSSRPALRSVDSRPTLVSIQPAGRGCRSQWPTTCRR